MQIVVEMHPRLTGDADMQEIYDEFCWYKENSKPSEHAAPKGHTQKEYEGVSALFGRDRFDKINPDARAEDIQHLHVRQEHSVWEDSNGDALVQWACTSDSYLIYSYFCHAQQHRYYLLEFFRDRGHNLYQGQVDSFILEAKAYRRAIQEQ